MGTSLFKMPFDIEKTKVTPIYRNPALDQAEVETITCDQMKEIYGELNSRSCTRIVHIHTHLW